MKKESADKPKKRAYRPYKKKGSAAPASEPSDIDEITPKKAGRPRIPRDDESARIARTLAQFGVPHADIADEIGIGESTLEKLYGDELKKGLRQAHAKARKVLFQRAVIEGDKALLMFYCKTQLGMRETNRLEMTSPDGTMTPIDVRISFVSSKKSKTEPDDGEED